MDEVFLVRLQVYFKAHIKYISWLCPNCLFTDHWVHWEFFKTMEDIEDPVWLEQH